MLIATPASGELEHLLLDHLAVLSLEPHRQRPLPGTRIMVARYWSP